MISYHLICKTCGENRSFITRDYFIQQVKAHPKGHQINIKGKSRQMNQEQMNEFLAKLMQEIKA